MTVPNPAQARLRAAADTITRLTEQLAGGAP
jgi:hypothetical protein